MKTIYSLHLELEPDVISHVIEPPLDAENIPALIDYIRKNGKIVSFAIDNVED